MFYANIETFQQYDPSQLLLVTYHYPAVTLNTIKPSNTIVSHPTDDRGDCRRGQSRGLIRRRRVYLIMELFHLRTTASKDEN